MCYLHVVIKICDLWCLSATIKTGGQAISCQNFASKLGKLTLHAILGHSRANMSG